MRKITLAYAAAVFNFILIGFSFLFTKEALAFTDTFTLLAFRFGLSFVILLIPIIFGIIRVDPIRKHLKEILLLSLFQPFLYFTLQTVGLIYIPSSESGVIFALSPVFVGILGIALLGEKVDRTQSAGFFISIAGIVFIFIMEGNSLAGFNVPGVVTTLLSVLVTSIYIVLGRKLSQEITPMTLTYGMMLTGFISFLICAVGIEGLDIEGTLSLLTNQSFMLDIFYLAFFTSIVTTFLAMYSLRELEAARVGIISNISTVVSILAGVIILHETFMYYHVIGSLMIISGVVLANYSRRTSE